MQLFLVDDTSAMRSLSPSETSCSYPPLPPGPLDIPRAIEPRAVGDGERLLINHGLPPRRSGPAPAATRSWARWLSRRASCVTLSCDVDSLISSLSFAKLTLLSCRSAFIFRPAGWAHDGFEPWVCADVCPAAGADGRCGRKRVCSSGQARMGASIMPFTFTLFL